MINQPKTTDRRSRVRIPGLLYVLAATSVLVGACTNSGFVSQPVDSDRAEEPVEGDTSSDGDQVATGADGTETVPVAVDARFEEPDVTESQVGEEIPEDQAEEPSQEPAMADPEDTEDVAQAGLGPGESALCATIQIGRDAIVDGAADLATSQQRLLLDRSALATDRQLANLINTIDDAELVEVAVLDDALDRCQDLGFEP